MTGFGHLLAPFAQDCASFSRIERTRRKTKHGVFLNLLIFIFIFSFVFFCLFLVFSFSLVSSSFLPDLHYFVFLSPRRLSVLRRGETGTGKELVAESVHMNSARARAPFVVFDCSAIAPTLIESELFARARCFHRSCGAHVGSSSRPTAARFHRRDRRAAARFCSPSCCACSRNVSAPAGGTKTIPLNVRVISATNRNLRAEVKSGEFREDLYYRVAGVRVYVPPLRDRLDDLMLLAETFWQRVSRHVA